MYLHKHTMMYLHFHVQGQMTRGFQQNLDKIDFGRNLSVKNSDKNSKYIVLKNLYYSMYVSTVSNTIWTFRRAIAPICIAVVRLSVSKDPCMTPLSRGNKMVIVKDTLMSQLAPIFERKSTWFILVSIMGVISSALGNRRTCAKAKKNNGHKSKV